MPLNEVTGYSLSMEYDNEEHGFISVPAPEFGAIFMSNIATKRECFKHSVFGLPLSMGNFVKEVKKGMILFLFEYERRQLFGVYRAISDGGMNIVPHAFSSSGKQFSAQVSYCQIMISYNSTIIIIIIRLNNARIFLVSFSSFCFHVLFPRSNLS